ncbi:hypothetical protein [Mycobacterium sp.]|uniref:hypothetical protein n=1 Tax=Mycobacterium sp. TaxID=1785 RepID=UPI003C70E5E7
MQDPHEHDLGLAHDLRLARSGRRRRERPIDPTNAPPEQACTAVYGYDTGYAASVKNMSRVTLSSDNVFGDGGDAELASVTGDPASGMTIALVIGVGEKSSSTPPPEVPASGGPPPNGRPPSPPPVR